MFYLLRSGCAWRMLPRDFPPWATVYSQFRRWRMDGTIKAAHDRLRGRVRAAEGRDPEPSAAIVDSQTVRCSAAGGPARGYDGGKKVAGRKRHLLVDTCGLVLLAHVHVADVHDRLGAQALIGRATRSELPRVELVWADGAYDGPFARWLAAERGWRVEIPRHRDRQLWRYGPEEKPRGFQVIPRRWVDERTSAWLGQSRRLARPRTPAGHRRGDDPRRHEPDHAAAPRRGWKPGNTGALTARHDPWQTVSYLEFASLCRVAGEVRQAVEYGARHFRRVAVGYGRARSRGGPERPAHRRVSIGTALGFFRTIGDDGERAAPSMCVGSVKLRAARAAGAGRTRRGRTSAA